MLKPNVNEIARFLTEESERNGGKLPELDRIAWNAYIRALVMHSGELFSHVEGLELRQQFPLFEDEPSSDDPVDAMFTGKHYRDHDPNIPEGECLDETEFESNSWKIEQDAKHLGGQLNISFTVAWYGKLLGLYHSNEITDSEYRKLLLQLPPLADNPVERLEVFMNRYFDESK
ncbi:MAG: hypothetical protein JST89_09335 [Cyanobacteria bacterium SZAS-4]|nr:hypothetical protein [Cyanobacteria bacterium SZAS-4]